MIGILSKPAAVYVTPEIFENEVTVNWVQSNSQDVSGYLIQYRIGSGNAGFKAWTQLADVPAVYDEHSYTANVGRGEEIQYRVRAKSIHGENYYSDWSESTIAVKNSLPSAVLNFQTDKKTYKKGEIIKLTWQSAEDSDDTVDDYEIEISKNNMAWQLLDTANGISFNCPANILYDSDFLKFRIRAVDSLRAKGAYSQSDTVRRIEGVDLKVCVDGQYKNCNLFVCRFGEYKACDVFFCKDNKYGNGAI